MSFAEHIGWPLVVVGAGLFLVEHLGNALVAVGFLAIGAALVGSAVVRRRDASP